MTPSPEPRESRTRRQVIANALAGASYLDGDLSAADIHSLASIVDAVLVPARPIRDFWLAGFLFGFCLASIVFLALGAS